jgi:glycerol kinase
LISSAPEIETLAQTVADNGGAYFVPAFSGLFAPYWRSDARGAIVGLTRYVNKGHLARAVLEHLSRLKVDGGMVANEVLMQFQSDILDVPVIRPKVSETTALGAAYAAGLAVGFWSGLDELRQNWAEDKTWQPAMAPADREKYYREWKKAVDRTFNWVE